MRLTSKTDYSLRVLIFLASMPEERTTIASISQAYGISQNHLVKVVHRLGQLNYVETLRGQGGGLKLAVKPSEIKLGKIVRELEPHYHVVECFNKETDQCVITPVCGLKGVLGEALAAFMSTLDKYTFQDVLKNKDQLADLLHS